MGLVGISLVLADRAGDPPPHLWKRIGVIAGCALAASLGSWLLFPRSFIYFGILHAIAVASVLASPAVRHPRIALAIGVAMIGAAFLVSHPVFDLRALSWIGFTITEDYVPLIPWAGVVFVGVALGHALARRGFRDVRLFGALPGLAWLGRHSLVIYMVHQPILLGILWAAVGR